MQDGGAAFKADPKFKLGFFDDLISIITCNGRWPFVCYDDNGEPHAGPGVYSALAAGAILCIILIAIIIGSLRS